MIKISFNLLKEGRCDHLMPHNQGDTKKIVVTGSQGSGKSRNARAMAQHFNRNIIIDDWDGETLLPDGALALTSTTFNKSLVDEIHDIADVLQAIQNSTCSDANNSSFPK